METDGDLHDLIINVIGENTKFDDDISYELDDFDHDSMPIV